MEYKSVRLGGVLLSHLSRATVFHGSPQSHKDGTILSISAKGGDVLKYPYKAFAERAAAE